MFTNTCLFFFAFQNPNLCLFPPVTMEIGENTQAGLVGFITSSIHDHQLQILCKAIIYVFLGHLFSSPSCSVPGVFICKLWSHMLITAFAFYFLSRIEISKANHATFTNKYLSTYMSLTISFWYFFV